MMGIPLIKPDLPCLEDIEEALREILATGKITNFGKYVTAFEEEASRYLGTQVVTTSSGTMGLIFALQASGLQPGQKVIVPSFTFVATVQAVLYAGGVPVFAEIGDDLTLSPEDVGELLERHEDVGAVVPVHTYGLPCHVDRLQAIVDDIARRRSCRIPVVYDAAHAFGSAVRDRKVGTFGTAEVFSLSVTKVLVSVEGGLVSSHDTDIIHRVRRMRNYGIEQNYNAHWPGMNGKMSELHAIIGLHNLRRLPELLAQRQQKARSYAARIEERTVFRTIPTPPDVVHTFKDFTILVPPDLKQQRDRIMALLAERGIETRAYFWPPVHEQEWFRRFSDRPLPRTEDVARRVITLPFYTSMTEVEMDAVVDALVETERIVTGR
jgi:dTDP-4-amino-4,6-dideoxygalactose transaminase